MKISLIITTKNESRTISKLLDAIAKQTRRVDEVIIADASTGNRPQITGYSEELPILFIRLLENANRAVGRNAAIREAKYDHILITDAGCIPRKDWVEEMEKGFASADVVAGYYQGVYQNIFEKCQIPYVLVMPDRLDPKNFLPATRSMGITKKLFNTLGGFNEDYRYAEDYEFARRIQAKKIPIAVVPEAVVEWRPRQTISSFARMIFEHAYGDMFSKTYRPKVVTIYLRYLLFLMFGFWHWTLGIGLLGVYLFYAIWKNYRYIQHWKAIIYLPLLQIVSDFAVMLGTVRGYFQR